MKKPVVFLLVLLWLAVLPLSAFAQDSSDEPRLIVSTEKAMPGDEVSVTITMENNPGIGVLNPKFSYDASRLEWVGSQDGVLTGWTVTGKAGVWLGYEDSHVNGVILTLRFRVLDSAPDGFADVHLICGDGDAYNFSEELILFQLVSGGVQVGAETHSHTPGPEHRENEIPPTCTQPGSYDTVVTCSSCGEEISRVTLPLPATGHHYDSPKFQWTDNYDSAVAYFICRERDDVQAVEASTSSTLMTETDSQKQTQYLTATVTFENVLYTETKILTTDGAEISTSQSAEPAPTPSPEPVPETEHAAQPEPASVPEATAEPDLPPAVEGSDAPTSAPAGRNLPALPLILFCCVLVLLVLYLVFKSGKQKQKK